MKKKIFLLLTLLLIMTGCSGKYDLTIRSDGKIEETLTVSIKNSLIQQNGQSAKVFIKQQEDSYKDTKEFESYKITSKYKKTESSLTFKSSYNSLSQYKNSFLFSTVFEDLMIIQNEDVNVFKTNGKYHYESIFGEEPEDAATTYVGIEGVEVNIHMQNKVLETNADKKDEKTNTYTWNLTPDQKEKYIYIKYDNEKRYDIIIKDFFQKNIISITVISTLVIAVTLVAIFILGKRRATNRI